MTKPLEITSIRWKLILAEHAPAILRTLASSKINFFPLKAKSIHKGSFHYICSVRKIYLTTGGWMAACRHIDLSYGEYNGSLLGDLYSFWLGNKFIFERVLRRGHIFFSLTVFFYLNLTEGAFSSQDSVFYPNSVFLPWTVFFLFYL